MRIGYDDAETAGAVLAAVSPENGDYAECRAEDDVLTIAMSSEDAASLRRAADDLLACIKAAESSLGRI